MVADRLGREPASGAAAPDVSLRQLAAAAGVPTAALRRARDLGLVPAPDAAGGRWSAAAAADIQDQWPRTAAALQASRELGAVRCAELLSRATGLPVSRADVEELATRGVLQVSRLYRQHPLFRVADLQALVADPAGRELLADVVTGSGSH